MNLIMWLDRDGEEFIELFCRILKYFLLASCIMVFFSVSSQILFMVQPFSFPLDFKDKKIKV